MFTKKRRVFNDYRNVIIMILILAIFLMLGKMIFNHNILASSNRETTTIETRQLILGQPEVYQQFLKRVVHQVLPAPGAEGPLEGLVGSIKNYYQSFVKEVFFVDLRNPYTFIKSQFPALALYDKGTVLASAGISLEEEGPEAPIIDLTQDNISKDHTEEELPDADPDDLGEAGEGIYIPDENDIIDSLSQNGTLVLDDNALPAKVTLEKDQPQILIYHTHGTESYQPASEGNFHTLRKEYSVIAIGEILAKELESQGYRVIHDTTYHDYPSYNGSYSRSLSTAQEILKKHPSIKVIFDVHRDGYDQVETTPNRDNLIRNNQAFINNETTTKFQPVIGSETPNRNEVEAFARLLKTVSDQRYPGFSKEILVKPYGRFNQFLVDHYALLEVGSNANTIEEARKTAYYLAKVIGEALQYIIE
ncbi:stage II sporulation protein P [Alkaliphilus crotonatoxidans]